MIVYDARTGDCSTAFEVRASLAEVVEHELEIYAVVRRDLTLKARADRTDRHAQPLQFARLFSKILIEEGLPGFEHREAQTNQQKALKSKARLTRPRRSETEAPCPDYRFNGSMRQAGASHPDWQALAIATARWRALISSSTAS